MDKKDDLRNIAYKKIKINEKYRFFNSNYCFNDNVIPFFKHSEIIKNLKNRVKYSNGASFLITGLRGVGKSTLVKRVLSELETEKLSCLPVYINLSINIEYKNLLFEIIRRLYEAIIDNKLLNKIKSTIANDIIISYSRTSMSISSSNRVNGEMEVLGENNSLLGKILIRNKLTHQAAEEASFLAYSANDVEHDLVRVIELLNSDPALDIKIIIVFDELDKLTSTTYGTEYFQDILGKLKNILCSVDVISIFIGGIDLYQNWNEDIAKINSLYDSIFSWHQYVPCIWNSTESLFDLVLEKEYIYEKIEDQFQFICEGKYSNIIKPSFKSFLNYINFKSKGIPRKIYSEFNNFIVWNDKDPYFQISEVDINEVYAYSAIWKKISALFEDQLYKTIIEMDLTYITCFNLIEYFFAHADEELSFEKIQNALLYGDSMPLVNINQIIDDLLNKFVELNILERNSKNKYVVTDLTIKQEENMAIKDKSILQESFIDYNAYIKNPDKNCDPSITFKEKIRRYASDQIISFWDVFEVKDLILDNADMTIFYVKNKRDNSFYIAILYTDKQNKKLQCKNCLYNENVYKLTSKYLLNTTDIIENSYIRTSLREIYNGYLLSHLIEAKIETKYIILIIEQILYFIIDLNKNGYFNANIKASNIMINKYLNVKFLDVKNLIRSNLKGIPISALGYAAPEMYTNNFDMRSDIYSIGVLLWEMISHQPLSKMSFERHIDFELIKKPSSCSRKLWKIIIKATKYNPNERYQNAEEFLKDIHACKRYKFYKLNNCPNVPVGIVTNLFTFKNKNQNINIDKNNNNQFAYTNIQENSNSHTTILNDTP